MIGKFVNTLACSKRDGRSDRACRRPVPLLEASSSSSKVQFSSVEEIASSVILACLPEFHGTA